MAAVMVDGQLTKDGSIKIQCDDDCFGYESFTYLSMEDFEAVFTLDWLSGSVIISYMMNLYEKVKNGPIQDHGICFVTASATMMDERKTKSKHIDESSKLLAHRLTKRNNNDIIIETLVLAILDMKTTNCYYLDSLRPIDVHPDLKQIIDAAMVLYAVQTGSNMRVKVNWVNFRCPTQPGSTECGYYVLNFMKEIVHEGLQILIDNNVWKGKYEYTDADFDAAREKWSAYTTKFIFR
ncbi:uncharacterized protein LOC143580804 [Bidens hawaiensis]|uniref:uncharacterized protein LOC143580804 n=1 Tax=Bidens hawaiensis TaxID=980011 RepID=UPI004049D244